MEAIVFDFKKPLALNTETVGKNDTLKNKDFSSTLESQNKKINNNSSQQTAKTNEDIKTTVSNEDENLKANEEANIELIKEEEKKDYSVAYGNMMYFFNTVTNIEEDSINNEEMKLNIISGTESLILKDNSELTLETEVEDQEILIEDITTGIEINENKINKEINPREFEIIDTSSKINDDNIELTNLNHKEIKFDSKVLQNEVDNENNGDIATSLEFKLSHIEQSNDKMEFSSDQNHNFGSSTLEQETDTIEVEETDKNLEINDDSFVSMDKNGIRFIKDNFVQLDEPDVIDRKEIIQQIVDKVKIDLSDAKNEIRVTLKPEVLGEMTMNIEVAKGSVTAKIMVDNHRTKEIIEGNLIQLKEGIKDTGLEIKTVEVFVGNNSDFDKHSSGQSSLKQNNRRIKIKSQDNKAVTRYGEQPLENAANTNDAYSENSLNLFA